MIIYLASRYSNQEKMRKYAYDLELLNHTVSSRWIEPDSEIMPPNVSTFEQERFKCAWAEMDLEDVLTADLLVVIADELMFDPQVGTKGGSFVEMGYAVARKKPIIYVGEPKTVFCFLHNVIRVNNWEECLLLLQNVKISNPEEK